MLTEFGKFLRKLRIDNNELLKNMADKFNITPSYLSAVETGKRNIPSEWNDILIDTYKLDDDQQDELKDVVRKSKLKVKFELNGMKQKDKELVLSFARELISLDEEEKDIIFSILSKRCK
jgi:HTH-type transcriptional regulator, competence development regulator